MSEAKIARRYARALVEVCAESKNANVVGKQLTAFAKAYAGSADLRSVLHSPTVPLDTKRDVLRKVFTKYLFAPVVKNFVFVLLENGRVGAIEAVAKAFGEELDALAGRVRATVTSATAVQRQDLVRIQAALQKLTGKAVSIEANVDPEIIGGVVTRLGNTVLDGSVRTHLDKIRESLLA